MPLEKSRFDGPGNVTRLEEDLHALHEEMFAIADRRSHVEAVTWRARARCVLPRRDAQVSDSAADGPDRSSRRAYFGGIGSVAIVAEHFESMKIGEPITGPAIMESGFTTVAVDTGATVERTATGNLNITPQAEACPKTRATVPVPIDERAAMSARGKAANGVERSYDGVRLAVLSKRFESVAAKMANTLLRTRRSGVLNMARDFSCCIVTAACELISAAECYPIHMLRRADLMAGAMKRCHPKLERGDVFFCTTRLTTATLTQPITRFWCRSSTMMALTASRYSPRPIRQTAATPWRPLTWAPPATSTRRARSSSRPLRFSTTTRTSRTSFACARCAFEYRSSGTAIISPCSGVPASVSAPCSRWVATSAGTLSRSTPQRCSTTASI